MRLKKYEYGHFVCGIQSILLFFTSTVSSTLPQPPASGEKEGRSVKERVEARSVDSAVRC